MENGNLLETSASSSMSRSMFHSRSAIEAGDLVIVYMSRDNLTAITITPGEVLHNKYGRYTHDDLIGQKFGTKILYLPDISYITMRLGIRVGGKVIEAGTGSGSMTHSLSRTIGPTGQVYSFEYHEPRYEKALEEFKSHGLENVRLQHRNVCKDGFGDVADVEAVFLDLPAPWEAIPHAMKTLRPDVITKICCFSPCLEQVLKTVSTLRAEGFAEISTQEVLIRTHELVVPNDQDHLNSVSSIVEKLKTHEKRKTDRRAIQMKIARNKARRQNEADASPTAEAGSKRKLEDKPDDLMDPVNGLAHEEGENAEEGSATQDPSSWIDPTTQYDSVVLTKPTPDMKGHTSYLTFASFYPAAIRDAIMAQENPKSAIATPRLAELVNESRTRAGSQDTEYGSDSLDEVMGTLTEEEMIALAGQ
ncbi:uncharacterized protein I303_102463 [Kwoniella dejecticola CBS 10117]|uniref:tRNA (adenine(58)-N(1))-methyltransferase catalytic subunit TRM61 n=1 Tax=Kwoniella dejecticola CBS 10117 TaxID=1296121 RepID=A0AAJ8MF31_9TREE